jgi:hypothetical protein
MLQIANECHRRKNTRIAISIFYPRLFSTIKLAGVATLSPLENESLRSFWDTKSLSKLKPDLGASAEGKTQLSMSAETWS